MDGVLANFDKGAKLEFSGMEPEVFDALYGQEHFWQVLNLNKNFFRNLEKMPGADDLVELVKDFNPGIITGIPLDMDPENNQKKEWATKHFPHISDVYCCRARKKNQFCRAGDILIDDRTTHVQAWKNSGGTFIVHKNYQQTWNALKAIGII